MQKKICAVYGEYVVTERMCQKGLAKFRAGYFLLDNALLLGMPVEVDRDHIKTLRTNDTIPHRRQLTYSKYSNISFKY